MPLFELTEARIVAVPPTTFPQAKVTERQGKQRALRDQIEIVAPECMVLAEEYSDWEDSRRRIDLLCLDSKANLVVVELKRTEDGGAMELQALRYAAMVSTMTFEQAVQAHRRYLDERGIEGDAQRRILEFLGCDSPEAGVFADDVKLVLVSADFSRELTTSVLWLNERELDIRCVQLRPYKYGDRILIDISQVLPLKEAEDYQVRVREKEREERRARESGPDYTTYDLVLDGRAHQGLAKRRAVLEVIRHLFAKGYDHIAIQDAVPERVRNLWIRVPGELDSAQFLYAATREHSSFKENRWFCADDELIRHQGGTFAVSSQGWTGSMEVLDRLKNAFPEARIQVTSVPFTPSSPG